MDGRDLQRCISGARGQPRTRQGLSELWRAQRPPSGSSAAECLKIGQDPLRRLEALRRGFGRSQAGPKDRIG
jgi:hypothetical protein